ncbi:hypothetical protein EIN_390160 [Entamoeba invadens IP1]|uniref:Nitroreductase domain-containing protein n=1 Tax=Entamoeba invadens IP1 TaxID=370355 RepID=A0A0A1UB41_ENTIV|nr:hypothetical protein EIN_390160 [Entamoeba invadens IP1]ELP89411.1 hypothetical protein EIN_390160 [Entamoeba invadens IP1]|eukprot:XP_004256182.1 hypothetical protein EIN_390160 [Entamoeba invadens IP1]
MEHTQRRTCRKFTKEPVSKTDMDALLLAGRSAPTARNMQPLRFYVLTNTEFIAKVADECQDTIFNLNPTLYTERMSSLGVKSILTYDCPSAIIITVEKSNKSYAEINAGFAAQNILVAASILGLATVPIGIITLVADKWLNALHKESKTDIDEDLLLMIAIGHPDTKFVENLPKKVLSSDVVLI